MASPVSRFGFSWGVVTLMALLVGAPRVPAQPASPDYTDDTTAPSGRRGERIRQVLDVINAGDPGRIDALVQDAFAGRFREIPVEQHRGALLGAYDGSQGLDFYAVRRSAAENPPTRAVVATARSCSRRRAVSPTATTACQCVSTASSISGR